MIIIDRKGALDSLEIWVEVNEDIFSDKVKNLEKVERTLEDEIRSQLGVATKVKLVELRSIQRSEGKAKRVFDRREI